MDKPRLTVWIRLAIALNVVLLAGCGVGGEEKAADPEPTTATPSVAPTSSAPPVYVENESCRTGMAPLIDIILANDTDSLDYSTFDNRVNQLSKKIDAAVAPCSPTVNNPIRKAMYKFALARAQWGLDNCDDECIRKVTVNIRSGISLARKANFQLEATA